ncbi:uroplakin-2 isoform X1 [Dasypus novemcinctus]|uniref:uroplakin-2 isoform X1 n=1 Tax=Dasypus novemcinctus TaxID=9361 RepID=UPI0026603596|nr:uroplakin-2 isoform X1 [Dasypus novemcinctus]
MQRCEEGCGGEGQGRVAAAAPGPRGRIRGQAGGAPGFCSPSLPPGGQTGTGLAALPTDGSEERALDSASLETALGGLGPDFGHGERLAPPEPPPGLPADFNISSLSGVLSPALAESLLVALPPCHLTGGNATLIVRRANDSKVVKSSFVVPPCRGSRALVSVVDSGAGFTVTRLSAYQVTNLVPGTKYYISYLVKKGTSTESSKEIPMSTLPRRKVESIGLGMARTGGMVVITVLLSVAMFLLVLGFIIALALGAQK